jgi:hypothetical protein
LVAEIKALRGGDASALQLVYERNANACGSYMGFVNDKGFAYREVLLLTSQPETRHFAPPPPSELGAHRRRDVCDDVPRVSMMD